MKINRMTIAEALSSLHTCENGLTPAEAKRRLKEYGPNRVEEIRRRHPFVSFLKEFTRFFSIVLWVAAALSFIAEWREPGAGMARIGYAIVLVIIISSLFSFWQEYRVEKALSVLRKLLPSRIEVMRGGVVASIATQDIVPGDIVHIAQGDHIPADCRLIEAFGLRVNNATVTGESIAQPRDIAPADTDDLTHSRNIVLAGTSVTSGRAKAVVFAVGQHTQFGRIAHFTQKQEDTESPLQREIGHLCRIIVTLSLSIGLLFFVIGQLIGISFWQDLIFAIGIIVAMVPEGLQPTLTLALVLATQRMAKRHVLIRHLSTVEALGSTTVICTDKTGTLTQNRMSIRALLLGQLMTFDSEISMSEQKTAAYLPFFHAISLCHELDVNLKDGQKRFLGDPMEIALAQLAEQLAPLGYTPALVDEIPFDTDRMRLSTIYSMPEGLTLYCKGAPETVLPLCSRILHEGSCQPMTAALRYKVMAAQEHMAKQGLRVIAVAYRKLQQDDSAVEQELVFSGLAGLEDPPRKEVPAAIQRCMEAGIKVIMVTGDNPHTAVAIAREIGLVRVAAPHMLTGDQVSRMTLIQLQLALDNPDIIFARVAAEQKMQIVEALKQKGHIVAVTGDGINDAPALKSAHIGIAMGIMGSDVAKEAADMVLMDDNFASIVNAIEEGRAIFENIRKFLTYILAHNVPELMPYLALVLFKVPLALTPLQILAIDMGTDSMTALGLGIERPDPRIMQQPPRRKNERLFNAGLALRAYLLLGMLESIAAMAAFFWVLHDGGWQYGQMPSIEDPLYLRATTACLSTIIVMQIVNVFLCRSDWQSVFSTGIGNNHLVTWGVAIEIGLIMLIDYTPLGNALLGTAAIGWDVWLFTLPFALSMVALDELRKWLARKYVSSAPINY